MFLEKHEPVQDEEFTWFDENGNAVDTQETNIRSQLSTINRYIVEISKQNRINTPQFITWLFKEGYRIYCINDCNDIVDEMTTIQKILFEREQIKGHWEKLISNRYFYNKEFFNTEEVEFLWDSIFLISKSELDKNRLLSLLEDFKLSDARFPNLSFPRILNIHNEIIIAKVIWGESYFKPQTSEEPVVLICYTAQKL